MKKTCVAKIFRSDAPEIFNHKNRFNDHNQLQEKLVDICNNWYKYLRLYHDNSHLLFNNKMPWMQNERVLVSTLAASIARSYPQALIMEELPVVKPAKPRKEEESPVSKGKKGDNGRCDLWVTNLMVKSEDQEPLCIFLEAKKFRSPKQADTIEKLVREKGIGRVFRDYAKCLTGNKITQRSQHKSPSHHYVISMLTVPFICDENSAEDLIKIEESLHNIFNGKKAQKIITEDKQEKARLLHRFPTVALIVKPSLEYSGMLTIFTVLGEGKKSNIRSLLSDLHLKP